MKIVFDAREYLEKIWGLIEEIYIGGTAKEQFTGAMFYSTLNICDAIQVLIQERNFVSSNILVRPLFEYAFRSFWLARVATNEEARLSMESDSWPTTRGLHEAIQGKNEIVDLLAKEKLQINQKLHSFTHGGNQNPLSQLGQENYITPNISDSERNYFLKVTLLSSFLVISEVAHLSRTNKYGLELEILGQDLINLLNINK